MNNALRIQLELGPKGKRVVAVAPDWPGLSRGAKTEEAALERLHTYLPRYATVATLAGMEPEFNQAASLEVIERYQGTGSTDFWGISFAHSSFDREPMSSAELERELTLMRACWNFFDDVRARVSPEMQKGPRGGGRDRDHIVAHTIANEYQWSPGARRTWAGIPAEEELRAHRDDYVAGIHTLHTQGKTAGKWPLRYLIRHTAFHTLDHAWEMEDKDLTPKLTLAADA